MSKTITKIEVIATGKVNFLDADGNKITSIVPNASIEPVGVLGLEITDATGTKTIIYHANITDLIKNGAPVTVPPTLQGLWSVLAADFLTPVSPPVSVGTNDVTNQSTVTGATATDALNNLAGMIGGDFGKGFTYAEQEAETQTSSQTPVDKLTLTASITDAGQYLVAYYCEVRCNRGNRNAAARLLQVDNNTELCKYSKERKDDTDQDSVSGFRVVNLTVGNHSFKVQFFKEGGGGGAQVFCRRARCFLFKVG